MYSGLGGPWGGQAPPLVPPPPPQQHISHFSQPPRWQHFTSPPPPPMVRQPPPESLISQPPPVLMMPPSHPAQIPLPLLPAPLHPPAAAPHLPQPPTPAPPPPPSTVLPPTSSSSTTPVQSSDMLQSALDTVAQAQGHIANLRHQLTPLQPTSRLNVGFRAFHPLFVGSLRGVKRKSLASALTGSKSGSHHLDWTSSWDSEMPPDLLAKCRPLHCQLCDVQVILNHLSLQRYLYRKVNPLRLLFLPIEIETRRQRLQCKQRCIIEGRLMTSMSETTSPPSTN